MCQCEDRPCCGCDAETRNEDTGMDKEDWMEVWTGRELNDWED